SDRRLGSIVAAAFADHLLPRRAAPAAEAARDEQAAHAAGEAGQRRMARQRGIETTALPLIRADAGRRRNVHRGSLRSILDANRLIRIDDAGNTDVLDAIYIKVEQLTRIV